MNRPTNDLNLLRFISITQRPYYPTKESFRRIVAYIRKLEKALAKKKR